MTTWAPPGLPGEQRIATAHQAVQSWMRWLSYSGPLSLHVADDGSLFEEYPNELRRSWPLEITFSRQERQGVGASFNAGIQRAEEDGIELLLYAVDDWKLTGPLDLNPWAELLAQQPDLGMIRLGPPHPWLTGRVEHHEGSWLLRLDRHHFAFAHRPALYHTRMFSAYGLFQEGCDAYTCEQNYNQHFCATDTGPGIALALLHPWEHISWVELAGVVPA